MNALSALLGAIVGLMLGISILDTRADDWYGIVGIGKTRFPTYYGAGQGQQVDQGFGFTAAEISPAWSLGLGQRVNSHLAVEVIYADLGPYNSVGRYTSDESYNAQCSGDCEPTATGWHHGKTRVIELSALIERAHLFGRVGFGYHQSQFAVHMTMDPGNTTGRALGTFERDGRTGPFGDNGFHTVLGAGVRFAPFRLEYQWRPLIAAGGSAYHDASTWLLSFEIPHTP